jgi:hypothetical protein
MPDVVIDQQEAIRSIARLRGLERGADPGVRREAAAVRESLEQGVGKTIRRAEAARVLDVTQSALDRWINRGEVSAVLTPSGRREVPLDEVVTLLMELEDAKRTEARPLAHVIRERRRRSEAAVDLDRLLPRSARPRRHRIPELQSLAYHRLVGERLDDRMVEDARRRLQQWRDRKNVHPTWVEAWENVLSKPLGEIVRTIGADSKRASELRQTSPFAGVLSEQERRRLVNGVEQRFG